MKTQVNIELQVIRRKRIKEIISEKFNNKIDEFARFVGKNKHVVYAMLWDIGNEHRRNITTDFARQIEDKLCLPSKFIDQDNETIASVLIDFSELLKYQETLRSILVLQQKILENCEIIKNNIK